MDGSPESPRRDGRIHAALGRYHPQFWLILAAGLISSVGGSMVWPFLTIYVRQRLGVPLTDVALLLTANSAAAFLSTALAGPAADRFGRKWLMVAGLGAGGLTMAAMAWADTFVAILVAIFLAGLFSPLQSVGGSAMVADLVPEDRRADAYALLRTAHNLGVAIGPAIGGFLAVASYTIVFGVAATTGVAAAALMAIRARETMPARPEGARVAGSAPPAALEDAGYGPVFADRPFLAFVGVMALVCMVAAIMMVLLPVYAKEGFGVAESQYGFIMATNAAMVVLFQYVTTRVSSRFAPLAVMAAGAIMYGLGAGSVALGNGFVPFLGSMAVLTVGELLISPTSTTLAARLAPARMRGRYMSILSAAWGAGFGLGPVAAGILNDQVAPIAMWHFAFWLGLASAAGFVALSRAQSVSGRLGDSAPQGGDHP